MATTPWDKLIEAVERRKKQLDDLLVSYRDFREKLESLPPEVAQEAQRILAEEHPEAEDEESAEQDLVGKSALDCARIILIEFDNDPMHFSAIAKNAMERGYRGRSKGTQEEMESRTINSFWAALHRSSDFVSTGKGYYKLIHWPQ